MFDHANMEHSREKSVGDYMRNYPFENVLERAFNGYQFRARLQFLTICGSGSTSSAFKFEGCVFYLVENGELLINAENVETPIILRSGELVVFPFGASRMHIEIPPGDAAGSESPGFASLLCGALEFSESGANPILLSLPQFLIVNSHSSGECFRSTAQMLILAARGDRAGKQVVINKLADALFAFAVCEYLNQSSELRGVFSALSDARLTRALEAIHCRTGDDWNLSSLARVAGMSRSVFSQRFTEVMGISPIQYLTSWRILQAKLLLQERRLSVAAVAEMMGYKSEVAFRKVFKRITGRGPGEVRAVREFGPTVQ
jgi:AraC family transcriptional regulator, activator of mtrCDE